MYNYGATTGGQRTNYGGASPNYNKGYGNI